MKVLLADDSMTIRMILKNLLRELGLSDITEAKNGKEALNLLSEGTYDLILTDIHMPQLDGLSVLKEIKTSADSKHKHVPVVVISSDTDYRQIDSARGLGAFGYIKKPFKKESLQAAIKAAKESKIKKESESAMESVAEVSEQVSEAVHEQVHKEATEAMESKQLEPVSAATPVNQVQTTTQLPAKKGGLVGWIRGIFGKK